MSMNLLMFAFLCYKVLLILSKIHYFFKGCNIIKSLTNFLNIYKKLNLKRYFLCEILYERMASLNLMQTSRIEKPAQYAFPSHRSNTGFRRCWKTAINFRQREINGFRMYCSPMEEAWTRKKSGRSLDIPAVPPAGIARRCKLEGNEREENRRNKREKEKKRKRTKHREYWTKKYWCRVRRSPLQERIITFRSMNLITFKIYKNLARKYQSS